MKQTLLTAPSRWSRSRRLGAAMAIAALFAGLTGCLETRSGVKEVEEKQILRKQVSTLQQSTADVTSRFNEIEDDLRKTNGRTEALDMRVTQIKDRAEKNDFALEGKLKEQEAKFTAFREEMTKLQIEINEVRAANQALQAGLQAGAGSSGSSGGSASNDKNPFERGEAKFEMKGWRDAIFAYEEYRKANPKGKHFTTATYRIGVSFQELGMNEDAKLFYEETISKSPKSKDADRARTRLKAMTKAPTAKKK
jgi:TolA-binding protein